MSEHLDLPAPERTTVPPPEGEGPAAPAAGAAVPAPAVPVPAAPVPAAPVPAAPTRIRVETGLSRYPIHRLARKGRAEIEITSPAVTGGEVRWRVTYGAAFGEPGPLAYKLDTLIVNRCLDEAPRPLPSVLRLGSLSDIARALGMEPSGKNLRDIRHAFYQNASAFIIAHIRVKTQGGRERWREIAGTRYGVVFTGDELPGGGVADAVYITPNTTYREIVNEAEVRPLDYGYLYELPPGPQRFYEILSFQVYGALASGRPRAKLSYGQYCALAPQVRYADRDAARRQMHKLHVPHLAAGYITAAELEAEPGPDGAPDWAIFYTPGPRARAEFDAFTRRRRLTPPIGLPAVTAPVTAPGPAPLAGDGPESAGPSDGGAGAAAADSPDIAAPAVAPDAALVARLEGRGIDAGTARTLLASLPSTQDVARQLDFLDSRLASATAVRNPAGLVVDFLRRDRQVPRAFGRPAGPAAPTDAPIDAVRAAAARAAEHDTYRDAESAAYAALLAQLPDAERAQLREEGRVRAVAEVGGRAPHGAGARWMERIVDGAERALLEERGRFTFPTFEAWCAAAAGDPPR